MQGKKIFIYGDPVCFLIEGFGLAWSGIGLEMGGWFGGSVVSGPRRVWYVFWWPFGPLYGVRYVTK